MDVSYKIGIDVGGTFTHAVILQASPLKLIDQVRIPTTHHSHLGVAEGIVQSIEILLDKTQINPNQVRLIAHSTTQATNALLEGDVAKVGVLRLGEGIMGMLTRWQARPKKLELAPDRYLHGIMADINRLDEQAIKQAGRSLLEQGAEALVVTEAFSVEDQSAEQKASEYLSEITPRPITLGSDMSQLYGLSIRTRTAALNASMLPKMIETVEATEKSVRQCRLNAPLMIMRSDGGIMDLSEVRKRPILTMLSGPAAGVAAALMYARVSDGIFLEVGGTSTDITVIKNGKAQVKTALIGGHRLSVKTLDVRTIGIAGGSMARIQKKDIYEVGPRSAHIAALEYSVFTKKKEFEQIGRLSPLEGDPDDYLSFQSSGTNFGTLTLTCVAHYLGYIPENDYARGDIHQSQRAVEAVAKHLGMEPKELAQRFMKKALGKIRQMVEELMQEYELEMSVVRLVGGGGAARVVVPALSEAMGLPYIIAPEAQVISAIGVALALVREVIERPCVKPTQDDLISLRKSAEQAVIQLGAHPDSINVEIEVDGRKSIIRATATGSTEMRERDMNAQIDDWARKGEVARSLGIRAENLSALASCGDYELYGVEKITGPCWPFKKTKFPLRVIDREGVIRWHAPHGSYTSCERKRLSSTLKDFIDTHTDYGDGGTIIPPIHIVWGHRLLDLSKLEKTEQVLALAELETEQVREDETMLIVAQRS